MINILTAVKGDTDFMITESEIVKAIKTLKNSKACGFSMILNEMIKHGQIVFSPLLLKVFNTIFTSGLYPKLWSKGYITPLHKKGSVYDPSNYRGITITDAIGKLLNKIINDRLTKYLEKNDIIPKEQIGFKHGCRTSDHMFVLNTLIQKYVTNGSKQLYVCFVDFRRAFDTVWHPGLFYKLKKTGVGSKFYNIIKSMYHNTELCVKRGTNRT